MRPEFIPTYHFLKLNDALDDLKNWYIRASIFGNINDGCDLQACKLADVPAVPDINQRLAEIMAQTFGFLCMTKDSANPILWERYAENNRGVCFGLSVKAATVVDVEYVDNCVELKMSDSWLRNAFEAKVKNKKRSHPGYLEFHKTFGKVISTKFRTGLDNRGKLRNWQEEAECRSFINLDEEKGGNYFSNFSKRTKLVEVILGSDCPVQIEEIKEVLKDKPYVIVSRQSK